MKQFFIPILIIILLLGLFIPIPSGLLDYLVILNVLLAIVLLFSVLLIDYPTKLTTLPSFLLILTLFRLVTNISTTRQILAGVEPGKIIPLIGEIVIQGSIVIGLVIFAILTLVQIIVVSKGAERVAEVSARFTLDALPGKQMSIDADVRAGLIDFAEARIKRQETQTESRFYGALDGAMKFIKGDAIVGVLITFINLIGGLISGIVIQQLSFQQAIAYYSLMSIGDGVISQIPAILNAIAAGILVTRVVGNEGSSLSTELIHQLFGNQGIKIIIIMISVIFACLPGIPSAPFLLMAILFFGLLLITPQNSNSTNQFLQSPKEVALPSLLTIVISQQAINGNIDQLSQQIQQSFYQQTGLLIVLPVIKFKDLNCEYLIQIRGEDIAKVVCSAPGLSVVELSNEIIITLKDYSIDLIDDRITKILVALWEKTSPEQVHYLIPDHITITRITTILKELIQENIFPKSFDLIIQTIAENIDQKPSNLQLLNLIRLALKYQISRDYLEQQEIQAITLEQEIDQSFFQAAHQGGAFRLKYLELIITQLKELQDSYPDLILVCSVPIRRFIWQCLKASGLNVKVLAYEELLPEIKIKSIKCIMHQSLVGTKSFEDNLQLI